MTNDRADSAMFERLCDELLAQGLSLRFQARGRSMLPTIGDGDILYVRRSQGDKIGIGDVVLFSDTEGMKAHRVVARRADVFITRGDAGVESDSEITQGQIIGKVVEKECCGTGRRVSLSGIGDHTRFFWRELRRKLARS